MGNVTLVAGPPCSGKTTWVTERRGKHDIVIDADLIAFAIGSPDTHGHQPYVWPFVRAMVDAATRTARRAEHNTDIIDQAPHIWIIRGAPTREERDSYPNVIVLAVDEKTCRRRALDAGRPAQWADLITAWWDTYRPSPADTVISG